MPEAVSGIWMALRHQSDDLIVCIGCTKAIENKQIYNERTIGTPLILCDKCIEEMVESRLELIAAGG